MKTNHLKTIYVLHKKGEKNHHNGLVALARSEGAAVKFREFSIITGIFKALFKVDINLLQKQVINSFFMVSLLFTRNRRIVLGIAPYDYKLPMVLFFLRHHKVFYHTSWTCWDGSYYPKKKWVTEKLKKAWAVFLEQKCKHIFAVSTKTREELLAHYNIAASKINVVYHTVDEAFFKDYELERKPDGFIYTGRLLPEKGLMPLLDFFSKNRELHFTVAGSGPLEEEVRRYADQHKNIRFKGFIRDKKTLAALLQRHTYLLLNARKTGTWEELFGLVIAEAMAGKTIPIATLHPGPREIITHGKDGFLVTEEEMLPFIKDRLAAEIPAEMQKAAFNTALTYSEEEIAKRWRPVFTS